MVRHGRRPSQHPPAAGDAPVDSLLGAALGLLAVLLFSLTLPATRVALEGLPAGLVGPGRAVGAAAMAVAAALAARIRRPRGRRRPAAAEPTAPAAHPPAWPPPREAWGSVLLVALGTVTAFPWLSTLALARVPAAHGAVLLGLLPLLTSGYATWRAGERPSARFWLAAVAGSGVVVAFAVFMGAGRPQTADLLLLAAIGMAAAGHGEGGRLARRYGGFLPIAWGLWAALPLTLLLTLPSLAPAPGPSPAPALPPAPRPVGEYAAGPPPQDPGVEGRLVAPTASGLVGPLAVRAPGGAGGGSMPGEMRAGRGPVLDRATGGPAAAAGVPVPGAAGGGPYPVPGREPPSTDRAPAVRAWLAWIYISGVTQLAGFVLWYRAMALAGVARTSQLQLLQPFFTLLAAHAGLGERVDAVTLVAALAVAAVVAVGRRAPVHRNADGEEPAPRPPARPLLAQEEAPPAWRR
ncbi:hypothetical protein JCM13210_00520 [Thermaerobacter litoralis]